MRKDWKRVAEYCANQAFPIEQVGTSVVVALEADYRNEVSGTFIQSLCRQCQEQDASLFKDCFGPQLETLRESAGCGIGRSILDYAILLSRSEKGVTIAENATMLALRDRAARQMRQVEEHYYRKAKGRAQGIRSRLERGLESSWPQFQALARKLLKIVPSNGTTRIKHQGLDDGVMLP